MDKATEIDILDGKVSTKLYDTLKWLGLIGCPMLGILLAVVGPTYGLEAEEHSMLVVFIIELSMGLILAFAHATAKLEIEQAKEKQEQESSE